MGNWVVLFSRTGSEIADLSECFGRWPEKIFTNNLDETTWDYRIPPELITPATPKQIFEYLENTSNLFITLHGFMRIIPEHICERHEIYNGHPGAIDLYPELKGKDPQERAWEGKYEKIGSVLHKVTAGVDEGEILEAVSLKNTCTSKDELYHTLRLTSFISWTRFLREKL